MRGVRLADVKRANTPRGMVVHLAGELADAFNAYHGAINPGGSNADTARELIAAALASDAIAGITNAARDTAYREARRKIHAKFADALRRAADELDLEGVL